MLLVNQNNVVDAKSVNASLIALKNQADKLNRQITTLEKSIKSLDGSKVDEKELSNYYTKGETYNKTEVYNTNEITSNYYNKQSVDGQISNALVRYTKFSNINYLGITSADDLPEGNYVANNLTNGISGWATYYTTKVDNGTSYMIQKAIHINGGCYVRYKHANVWGTWQRLATEGDLVSYTNPVFYKTTNVTSDANGAFVGSIGGVSLNKIISLQVSSNSTLRIAKDANYARLYKVDGTFAVNTLIAVDIIYKP